MCCLRDVDAAEAELQQLQDRIRDLQRQVMDWRQRAEAAENSIDLCMQGWRHW